MKRKLLSVGLALVLALSLCLVTAAPVAAAGPVMNMNTAETFTTIQAAIDDLETLDDHTIIVEDGTYTENIVVHKSLIIQAAASAAIIDGGGDLGPGVYVTAANVTFQGFTVTNFTCDPWLPDPDGQSGAGMGALWVIGDGATISDNIIYNIRSTCSPDDRPIMWPAGIGIDVAASGVVVTDNLVHDVDSIGIRVRSDYEEAWPGDTPMTDILVEGNTVYNTANTCLVVAGLVDGLMIKGNEIYDSLEPNPYLLWILASPDPAHAPADVTVEGNTIYGGYVNVRVWGADNINILGNTITDFVKGGIVVRDTLLVQIEGNIISTTDHSVAPNGIQIGYEIDLTATTGTVNNNTVSGCHWGEYSGQVYEDAWTGSGILVIAPSSALEIFGNEVQSCDVGLDIETGPGTSIEGNDVHDNSYGFVFWNADPTINFNNISGNSLFGVYRTYTLAGALNATNNWWGSADGPFGTGANPVSENVAYDPWLNAIIDFTPEGGATDLTATYTATPPPVIGISVTEGVDFGTVAPGVASAEQPVIVTNTGDLNVALTATITDLLPEESVVYSTGLTMDGGSVAAWEATVAAADPDLTVTAVLVLTVPIGTPADTYTATLVFWAEAAQ